MILSSSNIVRAVNIGYSRQAMIFEGMAHSGQERPFAFSARAPIGEQKQAKEGNARSSLPVTNRRASVAVHIKARLGT
jgi:hypothetical protein